LSKKESWNGPQDIQFSVFNPDLLDKQTLDEYRRHVYKKTEIIGEGDLKNTQEENSKDNWL